MRFIVIGISDAPQPWFPPEVTDVIRNGRVFSGGRRHHEIVADLLPQNAEWIDITVPLDAVFEQYEAQSLKFRTTSDCSQGEKTQGIIVFASGDPLFFGFANTLHRLFPEAELTVYPSFNSLQMLAHRLLLPYHDMHIVSLTGRPWAAFDRALIERTPKIGVLTDREHTPAAIAQRMMDYGYTAYQMHVGEHLGNPAEECVTTLTPAEAVQRSFGMPNCLILSSVNPQSAKPFGIPDSDFVLLDGREKMITKMPIRLLTLQALDLSRRRVLWDIGACTGSVSIEARLLFPHLCIEAFEIRPECEAIIRENARRHGTPGISLHIGDFLDCCDSVATKSRPDAVFIGGHGGHLKAIMARVLTMLAPGGVIVMNSVSSPKVSTDSHALWNEACSELGLQQASPLHIEINNFNPIEILKATQR